MNQERAMEDINVEFDKSIRTYIFLNGFIQCIWMIVLVIGVILVPLWFLGLGQWYSAEYLLRHHGLLTNKSLNIKSGVFFRKDTNIPLERITDISVIQGPLMRFFGIHLLNIETAGASSSEGVLLGITAPLEFRKKVLEYRDKLGENEQPINNAESSTEILKNIADTLNRIEKHVASNS